MLLKINWPILECNSQLSLLLPIQLPRLNPSFVRSEELWHYFWQNNFYNIPSSSSSSSPSSSHLWVCFERKESLFLRKARARHVFLLMLVSLYYYSHILFSIISQRTRTILWSVCSRVWIKQTLIDSIGWVYTMAYARTKNTVILSDTVTRLELKKSR